MNTSTLITIIACGAVFGVTSCSPPESTPTSSQNRTEPAPLSSDLEATRDTVRERAADTVESAERMAADTKDAFVRNAQEQLAKLDQQINELKTRANNVTADARKDANETLAELQAQRAKAAEQLGQLKQASGEVWKDVQEGLSQTMNQIQDSIEELRDQLG